MIFISLLILIVAIALPVFNRNISSISFSRITSIIFIYAGALSFNALYIQSIGSGIGIYSGLFQITLISQLFDTLIVLAASLILVVLPVQQHVKLLSITPWNINQEEKKISTELSNNSMNNYPTEYSVIVLMSSLGATLLISSSDLISVYLSIELQSFGVYILASLYRNSESAISAGLKYFLLGGFSSCILLLGCGLIYSFTGLTQLESIYSIVSVSDSNNIIQGLSLGLILIIIALLFKISAAPLHNWSPDVYDDSPTIVTIWLTVMPKISILILLLEIISSLNILEHTISLSSNINILSNINLLEIESKNIIYLIKNLLLISSLLSLIIGTIVGLGQSKIKRLLAYSTISHIGFILLALAINTEQSIESFIFYIIQYSLTNLNTFLILIALGILIHNSIGQISKMKSNLTNDINSVKLSDSKLSKVIENIKGSENDISLISELKGQFVVNPLLSISLVICLFSMAGVPPLIGFFSKQFVLYSSIQSGYYFISIVAIIVSVISASYYLKIIKVLYIENEEISLNNNKENINNTESIISNFHSFLISIFTLSILFFILKPSLILNSTTLLSLSLYNF
uniref:NADH-ubiquinone oxidoreductase chain 2 n=1 Tax=Heterobasidion irregulare TaxID=984962 RepID=A0A075DE66_9AGAM|nr:NADH dehydrogenase subunit 2 [Heterobasidion irregulare]AHK09743.1 NADH dehydrogenase subunit 2 [Heterobasidion irregulare]